MDKKKSTPIGSTVRAAWLQRKLEILILCVCSLLTLSAKAATVSSDGAWSFSQGDGESSGRQQVWIQPDRFKSVTLNRSILDGLIAAAPTEEVSGKNLVPQNAGVVELPNPQGGFTAFRFVESPIMEPELAAKFPEIKTFFGRAVDDPGTSVRFDVTPAGFHAQVLAPGEVWYIDPRYRDNDEVHATYYRRDYRPSDKGPFVCLTEGEEFSGFRSGSPGDSARSGDTLREFRIAVASTGEYGQYHGGTVAGAQAAIVTTMNRVNGIYEQEFAIRLTLVGNNDSIVYTNPATDPFTGNNDAFTLIAESQTEIDATIGSANYDIGHTFSTGAGGLASLGCVCDDTRKARGVTGSSVPVGDAFDVDYVAHEIGHQFDARHTFNGAVGNCSSGNRSGTTAYEPGSGSTIMGYAGICGTDNLQTNSDPIFHSESHSEVMSYITSGGGTSCASGSALSNSVPSANAGSDYTIPAETPFMLNGSASDSDVGDTLTYLWEQRDLGPQAALNASDDGQIPLFRVWTPETSPTRFFPRKDWLLNNTSDDSEKLPQVSRTMDFRFTVRDQNGGVDSDDMLVNVDAGSGPFRVTSPNTGGSYSGQITVTWDVANTDQAPVNASNVDIHLWTESTTYSLAANTPNDGSQSVTLPDITTSQGRIAVYGSNNIFFDVSDQDISVTESGGAKPGTATLISPNGTTGDSTPTYTWNAVSDATFYRLSVDDSTGNKVDTWFSADFVGCGAGTGTCAVTPSTQLAGGNASWKIQTWNPDGYGDWSSDMNFTVMGTPPAAATLISPTGTTSDSTPTYTWNAVLGSTWYRLWVNDAYGNKIQQWYTAAESGCPDGTGTCSVTPSTTLIGGKTFWWIQTTNDAGIGPWSSGLSFIVDIAPAAATTISPTGSTTDSTPTYSWNAVTSSTWYYLWVNDETGNRILQWVTDDDAGCPDGTGTCSYTPSEVLAAGETEWWVQTWNAAGLGPWSSPTYFTGASYSEDFDDGLAQSWVPDEVGSWTPISNWYRAYKASPAQVQLMTAYYSGQVFTEGSVGADIWAGGVSDSAQFLYLRASADHDWDGFTATGSAYGFGVDVQDGSGNARYTVNKTVNGVFTNIQAWTVSSHIKQVDQNRLLVTVSGNTFNFYINGNLVHTFTDSDLTSGYVSFGGWTAPDAIDTHWFDNVQAFFDAPRPRSQTAISIGQRRLNNTTEAAGPPSGLSGP